MKPLERLRKTRVKSLLWEWAEYHSGKGVMPNRIYRRITNGVHYMTIFDPRQEEVGKMK